MPSPTFTQDWFSRSIPGWQFILSRMIQKTPHLRILEVGVFEGRSTCWLLENFCKTPEFTIVVSAVTSKCTTCGHFKVHHL
jgi:hypothetical protein